MVRGAPSGISDWRTFEMLIPGADGAVDHTTLLGETGLQSFNGLVVFSHVAPGPAAPPPQTSEKAEETPRKKRKKKATRSEAAKKRGLPAGMGGSVTKHKGCKVCLKEERDEDQRGAWCGLCEKEARRHKFTGCQMLMASEDGLRAVRQARGVPPELNVLPS